MPKSFASEKATAEVERLAIDTDRNSGASADLTFGAQGGIANHGGAVDFALGGDVMTAGNGAIGLVVQSISSGGGDARFNGVESADVRFGGTDGAIGNGGMLDIAVEGSVITQGNGAHGIVMQSIGGGGGAVFGEIATASVTLSDDKQGNGGSINASVGGDVATLGDGAIGLVAQSLGGGGGFVDGHFAGSAGGLGDGGDVDIVIGGSLYAEGLSATAMLVSSSGRNGGALTASIGGDLLMLGEASSGFHFESLASDGAAGDIGVSLAGSAEMAGDLSTAIALASRGSVSSGDIAVDIGGNVVMHGDHSVGLDLASVADGESGSISLDVAGMIFANGMDSVGMRLESSALDARGDISATILGGVRGGAGNGVGIALIGGNDNVVTVASTLSAVSGVAMTGTDGNDRLINDGITVGNIYLGGGNNEVVNSADASFVTIDTLDLADGDGSGTFRNQGELFLGRASSSYPVDLLAGETREIGAIEDSDNIFFGTGVISQVALDGDFIQEAGGTVYYDVAFGPYASDRIDATGNAFVAGELVVTLNWLEDAEPVILVSTGGSGTDNGLVIADTIALDYQMIASDAGIALGYASDFGQSFLSTNAGGGLTQDLGNLRLSLAATLGWQQLDMVRRQSIFMTGIGTAQMRTDYRQVTAGVGYETMLAGVSIRPQLDVSAMRLGFGSFDEAGLEGLGVESDNSARWYVSAAPKLELGKRVTDRMSLFASGGAYFVDSDAISGNFRLQGMDDAAAFAPIATPIDATSLLLEAGLRWQGTERLSFQLDYRGQIGSLVEDHSVNAAFGWHF
ncbi:autotransporter outer membrane beta-barrel domain-containing protein [Sphingomicrobium arenosum]|uniref:autotransporter outer membrane beta-barrel domain-containing protein n=1 Tax=Sphingomicrobium arenosum TaxID=2233861 RepID=UPI0022404C2C|nr:autotransporter outer membrane beta-barrel domain-containing protein [Sphingomicrobium arenosum]